MKTDQQILEQPPKLTLEAILNQFIIQQKPLLLAINTSDLSPRLLTATDDKRYLVLFSSPEEVHKEDMSISLLVASCLEILKLSAQADADGVIINPWGKRLTIPLQQIRHIYFNYIILQYTENNWWHSPLFSIDYDALMWNNGEPYDEIWLEELIERQNRKIVNIAWWAKEPPPSPYKSSPLFVRIWLAFYGMFWLQTIFAAGLNTIYNKEIDEANIILTVILSIGFYIINRYLPQFNNWWTQRESRRKTIAEQKAWEAGAEERRKQAEFEEQVRQKALELIRKREADVQLALQALLESK